MLKNIPPILSPSLLHALGAMGHGDEIVIVDANFPAESSGPPVIRLDGLLATEVADAILKLMPLDTFVEEQAFAMAVSYTHLDVYKRQILLRAAPSVASRSRSTAAKASLVVAVCSDLIDSCQTTAPVSARVKVHPASNLTVNDKPNDGCSMLKMVTVN